MINNIFFFSKLKKKFLLYTENAKFLFILFILYFFKILYAVSIAGPEDRKIKSVIK